MANPWESDPVAPSAGGSDMPWAADPVTGGKGFKFSDASINGALKKPGSVVWMSPAKYLALTPDIPGNPKTDRKGASLKASLDKGDDVDEVPSLDVKVGKGGSAQVVDQDGRHRAQFAKDAGLDLIPVAVRRSGDKGLIANLVGMRDGSEPVPFDFNSVTPRLAAPPAPAKGLPRWDVVGDVGRAAEGSVESLKAHAKAAFPSIKDRAAQEDQNRKDYGLVGGIAKSSFVDPVKRMGNALMTPLDALGVAASPVTGALHATLGSALSYAMPGVEPAKQGWNPLSENYRRMVSVDPKQQADAMVDQASIGLGPEGVEGGAAGITAAAEKSAQAAQAAKSTQQTVNALRKTANLKPGVQEAHDAGYVLPPVMAKDSPNLVEKFGSADAGKIKIQQAASVKNQVVTNSLAAQDLGLPKDTMLTDKVFKDVRTKANKAYSDIANSVSHMQADDEYRETVGNLGGRSQEAAAQFKGVTENPELDKLEENLGKVDLFKPDAALFVVRKLRKDAVANLKNAQDPNKASLGLAQRKAADAVDALIERNLVKEGKSDLVQKYKAARVQLAKSHDIEGATNTTTGDVSAIGLSHLYNRGAPFTGGMKTIAESANSFRKAFQNPEAFGGVEPYSILDLGAAGAAIASGRPILALGTLARPSVRNALLSETYQNRMIPPGLANLPAPQGGAALLHSVPLPGVQNQLAKGIFRAAHVNGLRALTARMAAQAPPPNNANGQ